MLTIKHKVLNKMGGWSQKSNDWLWSNVKYTIWAQLVQNIVLGPRPPVNLNFPNYLV